MLTLDPPHLFTPGEYAFDMAIVVLGVRYSVFLKLYYSPSPEIEVELVRKAPVDTPLLPIHLFVVSLPLPLTPHTSNLQEDQSLCICIRVLVFREDRHTI